MTLYQVSDVGDVNSPKANNDISGLNPRESSLAVPHHRGHQHPTFDGELMIRHNFWIKVDWSV